MNNPNAPRQQPPNAAAPNPSSSSSAGGGGGGASRQQQQQQGYPVPQVGGVAAAHPPLIFTGGPPHSPSAPPPDAAVPHRHGPAPPSAASPRHRHAAQPQQPNAHETSASASPANSSSSRHHRAGPHDTASVAPHNSAASSNKSSASYGGVGAAGASGSAHHSASAASTAANSRPVEQLLGDYVIGETIGRGSFGKVKRGRHIATNEPVAIKILNYQKLRSAKMDKKIFREIKILRLFSHPNICRLYDVIQTPTDIYLVMEYVEGGELYEYIVKKNRLPEVISGKLYCGPEVDVWSCGVILYALLCGCLPFDEDTVPALFSKIRKGKYEVPPQMSKPTAEFISRLLCVDPLQRLTIPQIRDSPLFNINLPSRLSYAASIACVGEDNHRVQSTVVSEVARRLHCRDKEVWDQLDARSGPGYTAYHILADAQQRRHIASEFRSLLSDEQQNNHNNSTSNTSPWQGNSSQGGHHHAQGGAGAFPASQVSPTPSFTSSYSHPSPPPPPTHGASASQHSLVAGSQHSSIPPFQRPAALQELNLGLLLSQSPAMEVLLDRHNATANKDAYNSCSFIPASVAEGGGWVSGSSHNGGLSLQPSVSSYTTNAVSASQSHLGAGGVLLTAGADMDTSLSQGPTSSKSLFGSFPMAGSRPRALPAAGESELLHRDRSRTISAGVQAPPSPSSSPSGNPHHHGIPQMLIGAPGLHSLQQNSSSGNGGPAAPLVGSVASSCVAYTQQEHQFFAENNAGWRLGIMTDATADVVLRRVYRVLKAAKMEWKVVTPFQLLCRTTKETWSAVQLDPGSAPAALQQLNAARHRRRRGSEEGRNNVASHRFSARKGLRMGVHGIGSSEGSGRATHRSSSRRSSSGERHRNGRHGSDPRKRRPHPWMPTDLYSGHPSAADHDHPSRDNSTEKDAPREKAKTAATGYGEGKSSPGSGRHPRRAAPAAAAAARPPPRASSESDEEDGNGRHTRLLDDPAASSSGTKGAAALSPPHTPMPERPPLYTQQDSAATYTAGTTSYRSRGNGTSAATSRMMKMRDACSQPDSGTFQERQRYLSLPENYRGEEGHHHHHAASYGHGSLPVSTLYGHHPPPFTALLHPTSQAPRPTIESCATGVSSPVMQTLSSTPQRVQRRRRQGGSQSLESCPLNGNPAPIIHTTESPPSDSYSAQRSGSCLRVIDDDGPRPDEAWRRNRPSAAPPAVEVAELLQLSPNIISNPPSEDSALSPTVDQVLGATVANAWLNTEQQQQQQHTRKGSRRPRSTHDSGALERRDSKQMEVVLCDADDDDLAVVEEAETTRRRRQHAEDVQVKIHIFRIHEKHDKGYIVDWSVQRSYVAGMDLVLRLSRDIIEADKGPLHDGGRGLEKEKASAAVYHHWFLIIIIISLLRGAVQQKKRPTQKFDNKGEKTNSKTQIIIIN
eukprot:gene12757-8697_t